MLRVGREIATEIGTDAQGRAHAWAPLLDAALRDARFNETLLAHSRPLFAAVVRPTYYGAIPTMAPPTTVAPPTMAPPTVALLTMAPPTMAPPTMAAVVYRPASRPEAATLCVRGCNPVCQRLQPHASRCVPCSHMLLPSYPPCRCVTCTERRSPCSTSDPSWCKA